MEQESLFITGALGIPASTDGLFRDLPIPLEHDKIRDGDVVAFNYLHHHGVALMRDGCYFYSAYNLFRDNELWVNDNMPEEAVLLLPTKADMLLAIDHLTFSGSSQKDGTNSPKLPTTIRGMELAVRCAAAHFKQVVTEQGEVYEHIVKRWQEKLFQEQGDREYLRQQWEGENQLKEKKIAILGRKLTERDQRIMELEAEVERLRKIPTEDEFVKRLLKETKKLFKNEKAKADGLRQVMDKLGREDAEADLDAWMEGRKAPTNLIKGESIQVNNPTFQRGLYEITGNKQVTIGQTNDGKQ